MAVLAQGDVQPGDRLLLVGYGTGIADGFAYVVSEAPPAVTQTDTASVDIDYLDYLQTTDNLTTNQ
jgi:3-hydroxy-3-methylglutaryl CoA synthase